MGYALNKLKRLLGLDIQMELFEVEIDEIARAVSASVGGKESEKLQPHDVWEWAVDEEWTLHWLTGKGEIDVLLCGWTCVDMSSANKKG